jgi:3-oxoacyl-[acyl-carrier protein] reductase
VLVNNAGITQDARLQKMTLKQFDRVIDVNLLGVFHCAQTVAYTITAAKQGNDPQYQFGGGHLQQLWPNQLCRQQVWRDRLYQNLEPRTGPQGRAREHRGAGLYCPPFSAPIPDRVMKEMEARVPLKRLGSPGNRQYLRFSGE